MSRWDPNQRSSGEAAALMDQTASDLQSLVRRSMRQSIFQNDDITALQSAMLDDTEEDLDEQTAQVLRSSGKFAAMNRAGPGDEGGGGGGGGAGEGGGGPLPPGREGAPRGRGNRGRGMSGRGRGGPVSRERRNTLDILKMPDGEEKLKLLMDRVAQKQGAGQTAQASPATVPPVQRAAARPPSTPPPGVNRPSRQVVPPRGPPPSAIRGRGARGGRPVPRGGAGPPGGGWRRSVATGSTGGSVATTPEKSPGVPPERGGGRGGRGSSIRGASRPSQIGRRETKPPAIGSRPMPEAPVSQLRSLRRETKGRVANTSGTGEENMNERTYSPADAAESEGPTLGDTYVGGTYTSAPENRSTMESYLESLDSLMDGLQSPPSPDSSSRRATETASIDSSLLPQVSTLRNSVSLASPMSELDEMDELASNLGGTTGGGISQNLLPPVGTSGSSSGSSGSSTRSPRKQISTNKFVVSSPGQRLSQRPQSRRSPPIPHSPATAKRLSSTTPAAPPSRPGSQRFSGGGKRETVLNMDDPEHPDNWKATTNAAGKTYYYNRVTRKSAWKRPPGYLTPKEKKQPVSSTPIEGTPWRAVLTRGGKTYYHNTSTSEVVWTLPSEIGGVASPAPIPMLSSQSRASPTNEPISIDSNIVTVPEGDVREAQERQEREREAAAEARHEEEERLRREEEMARQARARVAMEADEKKKAEEARVQRLQAEREKAALERIAKKKAQEVEAAQEEERRRTQILQKQQQLREEQEREARAKMEREREDTERREREAAEVLRRQRERAEGEALRERQELARKQKQEQEEAEREREREREQEEREKAEADAREREEFERRREQLQLREEEARNRAVREAQERAKADGLRLSNRNSRRNRPMSTQQPLSATPDRNSQKPIPFNPDIKRAVPGYRSYATDNLLEELSTSKDGGGIELDFGDALPALSPSPSEFGEIPTSLADFDTFLDESLGGEFDARSSLVSPSSAPSARNSVIDPAIADRRREQEMEAKKRAEEEEHARKRRAAQAAAVPVPVTPIADPCSACGKPLVGALTKTKNGVWHKACFKCSLCRTVISSSFLTRGDQIVCGDCRNAEKLAELQKRERELQERAAAKTDGGGAICSGCGMGFGGRLQPITAIGRPWHPQCFVCTQCNSQITSSFVIRDDAPLCDVCNAAHTKICAGCEKIILNESYLVWDGGTYHERCLPSHVNVL